VVFNGMWEMSVMIGVNVCIYGMNCVMIIVF